MTNPDQAQACCSVVLLFADTFLSPGFYWSSSHWKSANIPDLQLFSFFPLVDGWPPISITDPIT